MIILDTTTKTLELKLLAAVTTNQLPYVVAWADHDAGAGTFTPAADDGVSNDTTAVTVVAAPGVADVQRQLKELLVFNADTVAATVILEVNNNATLRRVLEVPVPAGGTLMYTDGEGFRVMDASGQILSGVSGDLLSTRTVLIPPSAVELVDTNVPASVTSAVGWPRVLTFDDTTEELVRFSFTLPDQYQSGLVLKAKFRTAAIAGSFGIVVQVMATSDGDLTNADSFDADNAAAQAVPGVAQQQATIEVALANADTAAAGDKLVILFSRDTTGGDTVTGDVDVGGISIEFQATDD